MRPDALMVLALAAAIAPAQAADYRFDASEIEPRAFELGGYAEGQFEHFKLQPDAPLYPLNFGDAPPRQTLDRFSAGFELWGRYKWNMLTAYARASGRAAHDAIVSTSELKLLEGGLRISPSEGLSVDLGKQMQRWGKGYAWNPVAFFERPKDPNDPALSREGFVMLGADAVKSLPGTIAAVGFSPVLLPVSEDVNADYGRKGHTNPGVKLYLLAADTDIDLLWAAGGSRPRRVGADFSRNLGTQLEVHGEWARAFDAQRPVLGANGSARTETVTADSWLFGTRYITEQEVTWIAELYRNGLGFDEAELENFYRQLEGAFGSGGSEAARARLRSLAQSGYGRSNPGRRYAYLRVSGKDPWDWLYVNPALTAITNLEDGSWQVTPEVVYTGWQDLELRARLIALEGSPYSEFGAKASSRRLEMRLRLYF